MTVKANAPAKAFAPAKINLTLHVIGQRADGCHLLDSLVMFASIGDRITAHLADETSLTVKGPMAAGVPQDASNLVIRAADLMGVTAAVRLYKNLPHTAGLGGGSTDAAATLRALSKLTHVPIPQGTLALGADVPVCLLAKSARMRGIGDEITQVPDLPMLHAVLVNPNRPVPTATVFNQLKKRDNDPMPADLPKLKNAPDLIEWLGGMRNDLQAAAIEAEPGIAQVFNALEVTPGCLLTRMSGSGGTCFGLYADAETAASASGRLREEYPGWWVVATKLNSRRSH